MKARMMKSLKNSFLCKGLMLCLAWGMLFPGLLFSAEKKIRFNRDVRPILSDKCFYCHGPDSNKREADFRLDVEAEAKKKLSEGFALVPGHPEKSQLFERISSHDEDEIMPPADSGKKLSSKEIETLKKWIEQGAVYEPHWCFIPPSEPKIPQVKNQGWVKNKIDNFILEKIEGSPFTVSPRADKATLLRRLSFDLTGLPPTEKEREEFLKDNSPHAYEKVVDRLLASPHYGERLAIYWLDLVRYADTVGYHGDQDHSITPYRDYVIKSFNENMPFDQFTREQLAGDLFKNATEEQKIASGYNRVLQTSHEGGVQEKEYLAKYSADRVRNISTVWMGATMGCAECHDHKYDPYTSKDFYSMASFFADVDDNRTFKGGNSLPTKREPEILVFSLFEKKELTNQLQKLKSEIQKIEKPESKLTKEEKEKKLNQLNAEVEKIKKKKIRCMVTESIKPRDIRILARGDWMDETGKIVVPAGPDFLKRVSTGSARATRLDLANSLVSTEHPQTARVFMNRMWYLFFGEGISRNLLDMGSQGEWPTHLELLDFLSVRFIENGWNIKKMAKMIVMSNTYQQSSLQTDQHQEIDPLNKLISHQNRFRISAEMIRDNALAVSGLLNRKMGGPSAHPYQPAGYYAHLNFPKRVYHSDKNSNQYRRGVYIHWQRQFLHPMLRAFDAPSREECTGQRAISNTPLAALTLLNDPTFLEAEKVFAMKVIKEGGESVESRIRWMWIRALSRQPNAQELKVLTQLYQNSVKEYLSKPENAEKLTKIGMFPVPEKSDLVQLASWMTVARAIFNLNEMVTRN